MRCGRDKIKHIIEWHYICLKLGLPSNFVSLIVGQSGSGKTHTIKHEIYKFMAEYGLEIPFIEIDATQLTSEGWEGFNLSKVLCDKVSNLDDLQKAVIYVDEVDKLVATSDGRRGEHQLGVQSNFLKYLEGGVISLKPDRIHTHEISTAQMTWIFSGAFEPIFEARRKENNSIGFSEEHISTTNESVYNYKIDWSDIIKAGLMPELINRMNILIQTSPYSVDELKEISENGHDSYFSELVLNVPVDHEACAKYSKELKAGARGIHKYVYQNALENYKGKS
jgi:ATP-dependent protease Clp ATPase subunit